MHSIPMHPARAQGWHYKSTACACGADVLRGSTGVVHHGGVVADADERCVGGGVVLSSCLEHVFSMFPAVDDACRRTLILMFP